MKPTPEAASPLPLEGAPLAVGPSASAAVTWPDTILQSSRVARILEEQLT